MIIVTIITIVIIRIPFCPIQYVHLLPFETFLEGAKCVLLSYSLWSNDVTVVEIYSIQGVRLYQLHV